MNIPIDGWGALPVALYLWYVLYWTQKCAACRRWRVPLVGDRCRACRGVRA